MFKIIKKLNIILGIILLLIAVSLFLYTQNNNSRNNYKTEENNVNTNSISEVCFENKCFNVEIADNSKERETGLMNREYLDPDSGMLFVFEKGGIYNFWMKNTLVPLDIIWIDENNKIIFIKENTEPCKTDVCETFSSNEKAKYVLEINGRLSEKTGFVVGDVVEFR